MKKKTVNAKRAYITIHYFFLQTAQVIANKEKKIINCMLSCFNGLHSIFPRALIVKN